MANKIEGAGWSEDNATKPEIGDEEKSNGAAQLRYDHHDDHDDHDDHDEEGSNEGGQPRQSLIFCPSTV